MVAVTLAPDRTALMNLNQLKIFFLAIKRGSLTAAAAELNITQPAVTKALKRLQEHHEVALLERPGKRLVLTEAGKSLYRIAEKIFTLESQAEDCLRSYQTEGSGTLRIQASETFGGYYLPELIKRFKHCSPDIKVFAEILPNEKVVANTAALVNDVGFISDAIPHRNLVLREVLEERLVLIAAPGHPLAAAKKISARHLKNQSIIMHEQGSALHRAMDVLLGALSSDGPGYLELSNNEAIKRAVANGTGIALISEKAVSEEVRSGRLTILTLAGPPITRQFYMVHHRRKYQTLPLTRLMKLAAGWGGAGE